MDCTKKLYSGVEKCEEKQKRENRWNSTSVRVQILTNYHNIKPYNVDGFLKHVKSVYSNPMLYETRDFQIESFTAHKPQFIDFKTTPVKLRKNM